jgi:hypothetical protein
MKVPQTPTAARETRQDWAIAAWAIIAAFGCYFCMYAFRKPFTAAGFSGTPFWGVEYKVLLVTSQVLGYTLSKFIGIRVIAEMSPERRARGIVWLVASALLALVLFGLTPRPWNLLCLFLNGLPLGMVFGLVMGFLEGRKLTELLVAGLCASFILADGVTKSVGTWLLGQGVSEEWMPAAAGGIFLLPLAGFVWMLTRIPAPTPQDHAARSPRFTMNQADRRSFLVRYAPGITMLVVIYLLVTILRSLRADFQPEIWKQLGGISDPTVFTQTEVWVALGVLLLNGGNVLIGNNRLAFYTALLTCGLGFGLLAAGLLGHRAGWLGGYSFMTLVGLGLYLPYVAFHTSIFERLVALTRERANIGFLMYVVDSCGYLGYVAIMLVKNFGNFSADFLELLIFASWITVVASTTCLLGTAAYFANVQSGSMSSHAEADQPTLEKEQP